MIVVWETTYWYRLETGIEERTRNWMMTKINPQEFQFVVDSCCDLNEEMKREFTTHSVPFSIAFPDQSFVDDGGMDLPHFIQEMKNHEEPPQSACPAPGLFAEKFRLCKNTFAITITGHLSGAYNSAVLAKNMVEQEDPEKKIHVFDSLSASTGQVLVYLKLKEFIKENLDWETIIEKTEHFITKEMQTFFVLEDLSNLIKNGRMSRLAGHFASLLAIKPLMYAESGQISLKEKIRGTKRAIDRMIAVIGETCSNISDRILVIAHCNNEERANYIKTEVEKKYNFRQIHIIKTGGLSTLYANDGGIIISY